jgi:hypothetical protein
VRRFTWAQACRRRLHRHGLTSPLPSPADAAREPFGELGRRSRRDLDAEVDRVAAVLEARPSLTIGTVTARSHL